METLTLRRRRVGLTSKDSSVHVGRKSDIAGKDNIKGAEFRQSG